jgi:hypothetical protein
MFTLKLYDLTSALDWHIVWSIETIKNFDIKKISRFQIMATVGIEPQIYHSNHSTDCAIADVTTNETPFLSNGTKHLFIFVKRKLKTIFSQLTNINQYCCPLCYIPIFCFVKESQ